MEIIMPDILVVKCNAFLPCERMQAILDNLRAQKETGVILLPSYLEAQIVPDDIEIKLTSSDEDGLIFVDVNEII
jgi:hypothetical protein